MTLLYSFDKLNELYLHLNEWCTCNDEMNVTNVSDVNYYFSILKIHSNNNAIGVVDVFISCTASLMLTVIIFELVLFECN